MPLTKSGTIVVNGIKASTYVSIFDDAPSIVHLFGSVFRLSEQRLLHWWLSPYRLVCMTLSSDFCKDDYNEEGIANWLVIGRHIAVTGERFSRKVQLVGLFVVFSLLLTLVGLEVALTNPLCGLTIASFLLMWRASRSRSGKSKVE